VTYTSHGHHIPGTITSDEHGQIPRARCGGTVICSVCAKDANAIVSALDKGLDVAGFFEAPAIVKGNQKALEKAKLFIVGARNNVTSNEEDIITVDDVGIFEFYSNDLGWWAKALVNQVYTEGLLFVVTHTVSNDTTVVETYIKIEHDVFSQEGI
jgi:hypothetical protein